MLLSAVCLALAPQIWVSPDGADSNPGTSSRPFATIQAAVQAARLEGGHLIMVADGTYRLRAPVLLDTRDIGLTIEAAKGARPRLTGAVEIPPSAVHPCRDQDVLKRIVDASARSQVLEVDLAQLGLEHPPALPSRGFTAPISPSANELFIGDRPMTLARWPNQGYASIAKVIDDGGGESTPADERRNPVFLSSGDEARHWSGAEDAWAYGYWKYDWADQSIPIQSIDAQTGAITLAQSHHYGVAAGSPFYVENLIQELDSPGEYYIDRRAAKLYFIPPTPTVARQARLLVSVLATPLISVRGGANIVVRGLDLCLSRGDGADIVNSGNVRLEDCHLFSLGEHGAAISGGSRSGLESCDIWSTGQGGVDLSGGDRETLTPANNFVDDCDIRDYERLSQTYRPGVLLSGVGNRVTHCAIHDAPHSAIIFSGNDHLIQFNEFYRTISRTGDGGVVYTGRDWTARGTQILDNYFHDNIGIRKWEPAIYVDDLGSGIVAKRNVIVRCHWGFLIGGGRDNILQGNVIADCALAFDCDDRGLGWGKSMLPTLTERLNSVPYKSEPWRSHYPNLPDILSHEPLAPMGNVLEGNLLVRSGPLLDRVAAAFQKGATIEGNIVTNEDGRGPFGIPSGLPALKGFKVPQVQKMGLRRKR